MTKRTITIDDAELTDDNISDIVGTAAYGGINYWGSISEDFSHNEGTYYSVWDDDASKRFKVIKDSIRDAYFKLLDYDQPYVNNTVHGYIVKSWQNRDSDGIDCGEIDAEAADVIIQIATLGEVVYG